MGVINGQLQADREIWVLRRIPRLQRRTMTKRVTSACMIAEMSKTSIIGELANDEHATLETCESLILCLNNRRFVVVRPDHPKDLWPIDGGWQKLRDLQPGDDVVYKGQRTQVRAVDVYR